MMKLRKVNPMNVVVEMAEMFEKDSVHLSVKGLVTLGIFALVAAKLSTIVVSGLIDLFFSLFM